MKNIDYIQAKHNRKGFGAYTVTVSVTGDLKRSYRGKISVIEVKRHELSFNTNDSQLFDALNRDNETEDYREAAQWAIAEAIEKNNVIT